MSCESDDGQRKNLSLDSCESGILTDTSSIERSLVGSWVMVDFICGLCGPPETSSEPSEPSERVVKFKNDKTFEITIDGEVQDVGQWSVEEFDTFAQINVTPSSLYLTNAFTMCKTEFLTADWTYKDLLQVKYVKLK